MNSLIGIKTNWYTKVKKHIHVSKQLDYITYKIRLHRPPANATFLLFTVRGDARNFGTIYA